ncbi:plasmid partitioning protein RepB C-terminal domain-containing protein [Variovorax sp. J22R24]|uniref:plasmid partitioning protein RepB C-terminal domain-containing protein n=1 Tax=Variovorax gracilis TaxID=3053502 RepID=UPI002575DB67|nr:plasmid partitioning protein RepB C-terminal domain-containing protein [Variovorax sp. J22R24]MDM0110305.1 plasmid partitioning protein RepB C-terminal domain-containing protein [Variovorax sp. J22R24]
MRQLECVELMSSANNFTLNYARALLLASPEQMLVDEKRKPKAMSHEQLSKMGREMSSIQDQYKMAEETYGEDVLNLGASEGLHQQAGRQRGDRSLPAHQSRGDP